MCFWVLKSSRTDNATEINDVIREKWAPIQVHSHASFLKRAEDKLNVVDVFARLFREDLYVFKVNKGKLLLD